MASGIVLGEGEWMTKGDSVRMEKATKAVRYIHQGYACSQAILAAHGPDYGLREEIAFKIAAPFEGGVACRGRTCGAVTGAFSMPMMDIFKLDPLFRA
jgi:hypothetical protein